MFSFTGSFSVLVSCFSSFAILTSLQGDLFSNCYLIIISVNCLIFVHASVPSYKLEVNFVHCDHGFSS